MDLKLLAKEIDYKFNDISLLEAALTHRSVRGQNNERLEFLGDSIVNFIIAEALYNRYPEAHEGELSRLRAALVKGETLTILAREMQLGQYLRLGLGELKSGGAQRESILADAMEAIIAAIYLDGGLEICRKKILKWYEQRLNTTSSKNLKDPKTLLQELLQAKKYPLPSYTVYKTEGEAHAQVFYIECKVDGVATTTKGKGKSRRKAEQDAANQFLAFFSNE